MKLLVTVLGLITASFLSGEAVIEVRVKAYNATRELVLGEDDVPRGTRVLLTCDLEGLPEGNVVISYKWYYNCIIGQCEMQGDPYYTVVNDTVLVDTMPWNGGRRRHTCKVEYQSKENRAVTMTDFITYILAESSAPLFFSSNSLLLNHTLITDVQQITGSNGQQWINCTSGRAMTGVNIHSVDNTIIAGSVNTATMGPGKYSRNGIYYCLAARQAVYVSLFLSMRSRNLSTPTVRDQDTSTWTLTSPDSSRVERYIVEFECRVRSITFVEKYISVNVSGGTGRVAINVSCFGGLGQLYRVKVWAVSGPNISRQPALKCFIPDGQCMKKGDEATRMTSTPTNAGTGSPSRVPASTRIRTSSSTPSGSIRSSPNANTTSEGDQPGTVTNLVLGVGVGIVMFLFLVVLALVGLIVLAVLLKRRAANVQTASIKMGDNPCYNNPVVVELEEKDVGAEYDDTVKNKGVGTDYEDVDKDKEQVSSMVDGFDPYEEVDKKAYIKNAKKPALKASFTPASATNVGQLYAIVDKSKKKGAKKKEEDETTVTNKDDLYTVPVKKKENMTDKGMGASGGAEKSEDYDDVLELKCEPKADSQPVQQSEGDEKSLNADMLYTVVNK